MLRARSRARDGKARFPLLLAALAAAVLLVQALVVLSIWHDRFSFTRLLDVRTSEHFDDLGRIREQVPGLSLAVPTIDPAFEAETLRAIREPETSDLERFSTVVRWVSRVLRPGEDRTPVWAVWSPARVVERSRAGERFWCDSHARLAACAGQVIGLDTRVIWLDGHVVVEAFDHDRGRWIGADPTVPALLVDPRTRSPLSYAEAALRARAGAPVGLRPLGAPRAGVVLEHALEYQRKVLRRDLLVFVDGEATIRRLNFSRILDWLVGRVHGVRLVSRSSPARTWKRQTFLWSWAVLALLAAAAVVDRRRRATA